MGRANDDVEAGEGAAPPFSARTEIIHDDAIELDLDPETFQAAIVFHSKTSEEDMAAIGKKLCDSGISVVKRDCTFVLGFTEEHLQMFAEVLGFKLQVKKEFSPKQLDVLYRAFSLDKRDQFKTYGEYSNGEKTVFYPSAKGRLVYDMLEKVVGRRKLFAKGSVVQSVFLLHDHTAKKKLDKAVLNPCKLFWPLSINVMDIRLYYGEKVALYFAFVIFYTRALLWIMCLGLTLFVYVKVTELSTLVVPGTGAHEAVTWSVVIFVCFIILWSTLFLELWVRHRSHLTFMWDCLDVRDTGKTRVDFKGKIVRNEVTNEEQPVFPRWKRDLVLYPISVTVVTAMVILVLSLIIGNIMLKGIPAMRPYPAVTGVISGITVFVFNKIYFFVARGLTHLENHDTDINWEDSFIFKTFLFQFINSFTMLYYIAFLKGRMGEISAIFKKGTFLGNLDTPCPNDDCAPILERQLFMQFLTMILMGQFLELAIPFAKTRLRWLMRAGKARVREELEGVEIGEDELAVEDYSRMAEYDTFDDYGEMIIQFGYATLFAAAFPLAPMLAFLNNLVEIPGDYWKLTSLSRRPKPRRVQDIGRWLFALKTISYISLFTNVMYLTFASQVASTRGASTLQRLFAFFVLEHVFLFIKYLANQLIPDVPAQVARNVRVRKQLQEVEIARAHADQVKELQTRSHNMKRTDVGARRRRPSMAPPPLPPGPLGGGEKAPLLSKGISGLGGRAPSKLPPFKKG